MEDEFKNVVRDYLQRNDLDVKRLPLLDYRQCQDRYLGLIGDLYKRPEYAIRTLVGERPRDIPCVVMILESPHRREYWHVGNREKNPQPEQRLEIPYPANGGTGRNIRNLILDHEVFKGITGCCNYGLILLNAVQHQCSLGERPRMHKDHVFKDAWAGFGAADFERRISAALLSNDIVVNSCTSGPEKLHQLIGPAIEKYYSTPLSTHHPSSWARGKDWCLKPRS